MLVLSVTFKGLFWHWINMHTVGIWRRVIIFKFKKKIVDTYMKFCVCAPVSVTAICCKFILMFTYHHHIIVVVIVIIIFFIKIIIKIQWVCLAKCVISRFCNVTTGSASFSCRGWKEPVLPAASVCKPRSYSRNITTPLTHPGSGAEAGVFRCKFCFESQSHFYGCWFQGM